MRRQRARPRRQDREDQHRSPPLDPRDAAASRVRARLRPGRAGEPPRPAEAPAAPDRAARHGAVRADRLGRGARRGRAPDAAGARHVRAGRDPRLLAHRQPVDPARPRRQPAAPPHVRRLHRALEQSVGGGRDLRGQADVRRQGRVQERRARANRLRQLAAHRDVGLEPGRRHVRDGDDAIPQARQGPRRAHRLRRSASDPLELPAGRRARVRPPLHRRRRAHRHGVRHHEPWAPRSGLSRPLRARLRRGASATGRARRRLVSRVSHGRGRRRTENAGVGRDDHRHAGRHARTAGRRVRNEQAGRPALRLRAGPHDPRRAVPPRGLRARRDDGQRRDPRR